MVTEGKIKVSQISPHPQNNYYFDDIEGDTWDDLLQSIRTSGVTNAITITQDNVIISGHQRVRACKVLGIEEISYKMITYTDEKQQVKDLIESNLKQRVVGNPNPIKLGRCFDFLKNWYGIQHGAKEFQGNQHIKEVSPNNSETPITQQDLANSYNISPDTMENYIKVSKSIPELANLVTTGTVTKTTALAMMKNLSEEEQEELIKNLDITKKYTQKQVESYINEIKNQEKIISNYKEELKTIDKLEEKNEKLKEELKNRPTIEVIKERIPEDYEKLKQSIDNYQKDYQNMKNQFKNKVEELQIERRKNKALTENTPEEEFNKKVKDSTFLFCTKVANFIEQVGGYVWLGEHINQLPEFERTGYIKAVETVSAWADTLKYNIDVNSGDKLN